MHLPVIRTQPGPDLKVPDVFSRLRDVVYNLWWSWSIRAHTLFDRLSPSTWRHYRNPIDVLIDLSPERWNALVDDGEFAHAYHALIAEFDAYMTPREPTWFEQSHAGHAGGPFAYFSTEFGWHECLQTYSGGLGILSGDHCKAASDLGLPFLGIGLMYKHGYFRQTIDAEGQQQHFFPDYDLHRMPLLPVVSEQGSELQVTVPFPGRAIQLRVWKVAVGRVSVLLLDSHLPINHPADRPITSALYVQQREMRLCQEIVLGLGGMQVLAALKIQPSAWHLNEGHSALLALHRLRELTAGGTPLEQARQQVACGTLFTTHTPVPAGHESFDHGLVRKYLAEWASAGGIDTEALLELGRVDAEKDGGQFNLTALAVRTSARTNAVSQLHAEVSNRMLKGLLERTGRRPVEAVTNGVHPASWIGPEVGQLLRQRLRRDIDFHVLDPAFADAVAAIPDYELWTAHLAQKRRLVELIRERILAQSARHGRSPDELRQVETMLGPEVLTVGFARRFTTYKRADLLLRDLERLKTLVNHSDRPVQFVFAGKAHPADRPGQDLIHRIYEAGLSPELANRWVFLENYDMRIGRHLVQGVDVWLNTPRRPQEASGTSGMKAAMNGVLNCSILDGWWCEGYDANHGWAIGSAAEGADEAAQDQQDADSLYRTLAEEIAPCYYARNEQGLPAAWITRMKLSIARLTPRFSTERMVRDYVERYYLPAARGELVP